MGLIKAVKETIGGSLADQWLEVIEPESMGDQTVMTPGIRTGKGANRKGGEHVISNGSVIHVYEGQFMMLLDGGKIVDYSAQPGYFTVDNSSMPSMFSGSMEDVLASSFDRFRYGGATPTTQKVLYINLQEIKGIRFGTRNPISYFDRFYNAELFLRAHGTYSIRIVDPIRFYAEALPKNRDQVEITEINEQYLFEFMEALQACINQLSADGVSISYVPSKSRELSRYMADTLDGEWKKTRGMEIQSVAIASVSYDDQSRKLIQMRNQGAMLQDPSIREGYMQGAVARGMESAGKNPAGSAMGFGRRDRRAVYRLSRSRRAACRRAWSCRCAGADSDGMRPFAGGRFGNRARHHPLHRVPKGGALCFGAHCRQCGWVCFYGRCHDMEGREKDLPRGRSGGNGG